MTLFHHVYWRVHDQLGGDPYSVIILDFEFNNGEDDLSVLNCLSSIGEWIYAPIIGNIGDRFFMHNDLITLVNNINPLEDYFDQVAYVKWRTLREKFSSRYIGLCLTRFLGRLPYGEDIVPIKRFNYNEDVHNKEHNLWCNASLALASNLIRNFQKWGWSIKISGVNSGGLVENLPANVDERNDYEQLISPIDKSIGIEAMLKLSKVGFIPLVYLQRTNLACFLEVNSIYRANVKSCVNFF